MALTPLQRFDTGIPSETTRPTYILYLNKFFNYSKISHDEFLEYETKDQEALFEQYIFYLRGIADKTGKYQNSFNTMIAPLKLFCIMNGVLINWVRLYRMFPKTRKLSNRLAYDDNDIKLFLDHCDNLRDIAFVHFMGSTAVRIGEVCKLNIGDVIPIEDGAIVNYYAGDKEEYKVCLTPEAYGYLLKYLETRINRKDEAPLFTNKKGMVESRLAKSTVSEFMKELRYRINPNQIRDGKRKDKAPNNAYRKRLENIFADAEVPDRYSNYLLDHNKAKQDPHYFTDISNERLWAKFKKAIPLITIDKSKQIIATKDDEIEKLRESYEGEFKEKQEFLEEQIINMQGALVEKTFVHYDSIWGNLSRIEQLQSLDESEFEEYNQVCDKLGLKSSRIPPLTPSEKLLRKKWHEQLKRRDLKYLIKIGAPKKEIELQKQRESEFMKKSKELINQN